MADSELQRGLQPDAESAADLPAPSGNNGSRSAPATVARQPHPVDPNRWADGTVRAGNGLAVRHGGRKRQPLADPESSELYRGWASDLGDEPSTGERAILRRAAEADAVCASAFHYLRNTRESWTSRRVQVALQTLAVHASTVFKAAAVLGVKRRAKPLPDARDIIAEYAAREQSERTS